MHKSHYADIKAYATKDGSIIRELIHPQQHDNKAQSLAEATILPGRSTQLHKHIRSEEIYHVTAGQGRMILGQESFDLGVGDSVVIAPGISHRVSNTGDTPLIILCSCSPPYADQDTVLL